MIDNEHSANDARTLRSMLRAAAHTQAVVLGRPLRFDPDEIRRYLDLGAEGILCPFINTGKERGVLWKPCRYPPQGIRGYGPRRAGVYGFDADEYFHQANEALPCITIIESEQGAEHITATKDIVEQARSRTGREWNVCHSE